MEKYYKYVEKIKLNNQKKERIENVFFKDLLIINKLNIYKKVDEKTKILSILQPISFYKNISYQDIFIEFGKEIADLLENASFFLDLPIKEYKKRELQLSKSRKKEVKIIKTIEQLVILEFIENKKTNWNDDFISGYIVWSEKLIRKYNCENKEIYKDVIKKIEKLKKIYNNKINLKDFLN